ncbi:uncharacterized protein KZ484_020244 isoform 2-T2 [Pholidichthys leucotaenia]
MMNIDGLVRLPTEVWVYVFSFLSTEERHTVRLCSKDMKMLVDHPYLWRNHNVSLSSLRRYNKGFWDTLKTRDLTRIAVQELDCREWRHLARNLSTLKSIVFANSKRVYHEAYLDHLSHFSSLSGLGARNYTWNQRVLGQGTMEHLRHRLVRLSICNVRVPDTEEFINCVAGLVSLRYLLLHKLGETRGPEATKPLPRESVHKLLLNLRSLRHLSLGMRGEPTELLPDDYLSPPDPNYPGRYGGPQLTTLELIDYPEGSLSKTALRSQASLKSLTIRYRYITDGIECHLQSWLACLQQLESLTIIGGNSLATYTTTIPRSVSRLTLRVGITLKDLDSIAPKVKELKHLDIEQNRSSGSLCKRIPLLFTKLKSLRISSSGAANCTSQRHSCEWEQRD